MNITTKEKLKHKMLEPLYREDALSIVISRYFTDVNGTILDKNTVPATLQTDYPVYLFGEFDRQGAYYLSLKNTPPLNSYEYLCNFIYTVNYPFFFGMNGLTDIERELQAGDLITVYTDSVKNPNYYVWIVQHAPNRSIGSILSNLANLPMEPQYGYLRVASLKYATGNDEQWKIPFNVLTTDYLGLIKSNYVEPFIYRTSKSYDNGFVEMNMNFILTQYIGFNTYMLFNTDSINFVFQLKIKK